MLDKIKTRGELKAIISHAKRQGKQIVFTNGCFDLLHVGHIRYLGAARQQGDMLVVAVNSDSSVRTIKGDLRPIVSQEQRAELLAALEMVDYVTIFDEPDPSQIIAQLQPSVLIKGSDWAIDKIIGRETVEAAGGRVAQIQLVPGASTSEIIRRIIQRYGSAAI